MGVKESTLAVGCLLTETAYIGRPESSKDVTAYLCTVSVLLMMISLLLKWNRNSRNLFPVEEKMIYKVPQRKWCWNKPSWALWSPGCLGLCSRKGLQRAGLQKALSRTLGSPKLSA